MEQVLKRNSLRKNFNWNFIGNLIYAATQWGLIIVMTRFGNVEMVGVFSLGLAVTGPIIMFTNLQLRTVQATTQDKSFHFSEFLAVRILANIIFCFILFTLIFASDYKGYTVVIICLVAVSKIVESLSDLAYGLFQQKERMELIAKSTIMRGISSLFIVFIIVYFTNNLIAALIGLIICWFLVLIFYDIKNVYRFSMKFRPVFKKKEIISIIKLSLPLGIVVMIVSLNTNLPKILIENMIDAEALGYFASISYLVFVGSKFINSIGNAMLPRLAILYEKGNKKNYNKYLLILVSISAMIGMFLTLASYFGGEYILYVIYGSEFVSYRNLFVLIMVYGTFNYISYSLIVGLNAMRKFKIQPYLGIIWLTISAISLLLLIPEYGLIGAAWSLIIYSVSRISTVCIVLYLNLKSKKI